MSKELPIYLPWKLIKRYEVKKTEEELKKMGWYEQHMYERNYERHNGLEDRCRFAHQHLTRKLENKMLYNAAYKLKYPKSPHQERDLSVFYSYIGVEEKMNCQQIMKKHKLGRQRANQLFWVMMREFFSYVKSYPSVLKEFQEFGPAIATLSVAQDVGNETKK